MKDTPVIGIPGSTGNDYKRHDEPDAPQTDLMARHPAQEEL